MSFEQRRRWIIKWLRAQPEGSWADVLNAHFVDAYLEEFKPRFAEMPFGAHKCPQLGRDLTRMHREGTLTRSTSGISGMAGMGFPRWVYTYKLSPYMTANKEFTSGQRDAELGIL
jgi:hypothetical protein